MNEKEPINRCKLTLRHIRRDLVDDLYELKSVSGRPVWALAEAAIAHWLHEIVWPTLQPPKEPPQAGPISSSRIKPATRTFAAIAKPFRYLWLRWR
jgi:superoxide dismutase